MHAVASSTQGYVKILHIYACFSQLKISVLIVSDADADFSLFYAVLTFLFADPRRGDTL